MFDVTTFDWLSFGGGAFLTAMLAETFKTTIMEITKKEFKNVWKTLLALPCGFLVAILLQMYSGEEGAINWNTIPGMTLVYWGTSSIWYNLIIKKFGEVVRSFGNDT